MTGKMPVIRVLGDPYLHSYRAGGELRRVMVQDAGFIAPGNPFPDFFRLRVAHDLVYLPGDYEPDHVLEVYDHQLRVMRYPRLREVTPDD